MFQLFKNFNDKKVFYKIWSEIVPEIEVLTERDTGFYVVWLS